MNETYKQIENIDIRYFWDNYHFTSIYSKQRKSKKQPIFQNYLANNSPLTTFQIDLVTFIEKDVKSPLYVLLCVCQVTKYAFCSFLQRKLSKDVIQGISSILHKIKEKKKMNPFNVDNNFITFYGDFGQEFIFEVVKKFCKENNSKLINAGMPTVSKLGIVERLIRTLQEMLSVTLNDVTTKQDYKKEFKLVLKMYNKQKHTFLKNSPEQSMFSLHKYRKPWDISRDRTNDFDYYNNKKLVKEKLILAKQRFPLNQTVRLFKKAKTTQKRSHVSTWSNQIYSIDGYKIPLLSKSDIGLYLKDQKGNRINGITYSPYIKKVIQSDYMQIKNIIAYMNRKKSVKCSFVNYPDSYYKDIKVSELNKYIIPKRLRKKIKHWREKNGF